MWKSEQKIKPNKPIWCHHTKLNTLQHLVHTYIHRYIYVCVWLCMRQTYQIIVWKHISKRWNIVHQFSIRAFCLGKTHAVPVLKISCDICQTDITDIILLTYSRNLSLAIGSTKFVLFVLARFFFICCPKHVYIFFSHRENSYATFLWSLYIFVVTVYARVCKKHRGFEYIHKYNANSCDYDNSTSILMIFICFSHINGRTLRSTASRQSALTTAISITTTTTITTNFIAKIVYICADTMRKGWR